MTEKNTSKDIMDIKELAEYLQIHPATVYKLVRVGKIPGFKIGYDWRFHKKLIDKWIVEKVQFNSKRQERRKC